MRPDLLQGLSIIVGERSASVNKLTRIATF